MKKLSKNVTVHLVIALLLFVGICVAMLPQTVFGLIVTPGYQSELEGLSGTEQSKITYELLDTIIEEHTQLSKLSEPDGEINKKIRGSLLFKFEYEVIIKLHRLRDEILSGNDTMPSIVVHNPNTSPEQAKLISATDNVSTYTKWYYKQVPVDAIYDDYASLEGLTRYTENKDIVLDREGYNETRILFVSENTEHDRKYAFSEPIVGIDTTAPSITITGNSTYVGTGPSISRSVLRATDNDTDYTKWYYKQILARTLDVYTLREDGIESLEGFTHYTEGENIVLDEEDNGTSFLFISEDAAGNRDYMISSVIKNIVEEQDI